jgi:N-acetyl sugar amidotransferase
MFNEHGECSACTNAKKKREIDWDSRKQELLNLLDRHDGKCIVPSSGGKDSTAQVINLKELGADVTCVTATTCHLTDFGRKNLDNLARIATTYEVSPNKTVRAKLNRAGLELVGDISFPEHVSIFTTPFKMSVALGIPLIMYGESPQLEYGGPSGSEKAKEMTLRWRSEYGGFLGLRPQDLIGHYGLTKHDMDDYMLPSNEVIAASRVEAHFLGQYIPWDSHKNAEIAKAHGMIQQCPSSANWWDHENLDNAQTGIHDYMMWRKYGYGRACGQLSVDLRAGRITREQALIELEKRDGKFPYHYAGVDVNDMLDRIGMNFLQLVEIMDRYTNKEIHAGHAHHSDNTV